MALSSTLKMSFLKCSRLPLIRYLSSNAISSNVVITDDESTFVAWHPKQDFPYECTKPLPEPVHMEDNSVLKMQVTKELLEVINRKNVDHARQELANITHTCRHRWYPRSRDKKSKKTPMDRQYL